MNCPTCGTLLPDAPDSFCGECGAQLSAPAPSPSHTLTVTVGSLTNVGKTRAEPNQDHIIAVQNERFGLFAVADGMGGHAAGDIASELALERLFEVIDGRLAPSVAAASETGALATSQTDTAPPPAAIDPGALLRLAVLEAHAAVSRFNEAQRVDSGSTLTAALLLGDQLFIGHVGDSRAYQHENDQLTQITNDHSLVGDLCRKGLISRDEIYVHPRRSEILQSLGQPGEPPEVEIHRLSPQPGQQFLLCSDGLWEMVRDPQISRILSQNPDPEATVAALIQAANEGGGEDNISAVIIRIV